MNLKPVFSLLLLATITFACSQKSDEVAEKKEELKSLKKEQNALKNKIKQLEQEIADLDPEFAKKTRKETLITTIPVKNGTFEHYIEVSGSVKSRKNVLISAENAGNIVNVRVVEGDQVRKGEIIATQDTELLERSLSELETQYDLAKSLYEKRSNLWEKNIGTEVQYLEAKNKKESLERQIENVKTQIRKAKIKAPFTGTVEEVFVKVGEMAQPGAQVARIVNHGDTYVSADVSESHIGSFRQRDSVIIEFPSINKTIKTKITAIGHVINPQNRTFKVEAKIPDVDFELKPNLVSLMKIKNFKKDNAISIPTNLIQQDNEGEYVYVVKKSEDRTVAEKNHIKRSRTYKNLTLVDSGLHRDDMLIKEGFRDVTPGTPVRIVESVL